MNLLEYYQNQYTYYDNETYILRKTKIPPKGNINLYGVCGAGKSAMVLDFLDKKDPKTTLYIDLDDPNLIFNTLTTPMLEHHINTFNIELLVLDHYKKRYLYSFPKVERLIILSRTKIADFTFIPIQLFPLDYEEFLAFENSFSATHTFNHFLRIGTLPTMAKLKKLNHTAMKNFMQINFDIKQQKLLLILAQHQTKHLTTHQIYLFAKEKFKVSKDWLYSTIKLFKDEGVVLFVENRYKKSGQKIILFDFAFAKYLTKGQPFIIQFDNMIALELAKHFIYFQTLGIHGYITKENELIIPAPFESEESFWVKSQGKFFLYKQYNVKKITIVTVANSYEYYIEKLHFEALPFHEWTILNF